MWAASPSSVSGHWILSLAPLTLNLSVPSGMLVYHAIGAHTYLASAPSLSACCVCKALLVKTGTVWRKEGLVSVQLCQYCRWNPLLICPEPQFPFQLHRRNDLSPHRVWFCYGIRRCPSRGLAPSLPQTIYMVPKLNGAHELLISMAASVGHTCPISSLSSSRTLHWSLSDPQDEPKSFLASYSLPSALPLTLSAP